MSNEEIKHTGPDRAELEKIAAQLDAAQFDDSFETDAQAESQPAQDAADSEGSEGSLNQEDKKEATKTDTEAENADEVEKQDEPVEKDAEKEVPVDKAQKEQARQAKAWQKIEEAKEQLRREKAEFEQRNAFKIEQPKQDDSLTIDTKAKTVRDDSGFTVQEYEDAARRFEESGDYDHARTAKARAAELQRKSGEAQRGELLRQWNENVEATLKEHPAFTQRDSDENREIQELLRTDPVFTFHPKGFKAAARLVLAERKAASVPVLEAETIKLKKEITRLNGLLSVGGDGGAVRHHGTQSFDEMSLADQKKVLARMAKEADGSL